MSDYYIALLAIILIIIIIQLQSVITKQSAPVVNNFHIKKEIEYI